MKHAGITIKRSSYSVKETIDKLQSFIESKGGTIYARIDQQAEVEKTGATIGPLEFLLFGNAVAGGKIMQENPVAALDLPLKIIAWQDDDKNVQVAYNEAAYLQERYTLTPDDNSPLLLDKLVSSVITPWLS